MLLIKPEELSVNDSMCEIQVHGSRDFPFQGYINENRSLQGEGWHWHKEAEFLLVSGRKYTLREQRRAVCAEKRRRDLY